MKKKTNPNNSPEFSRDREFTVVLESINTNITTIIDDIKGLKDRVNFMNNELGRQKEDIFSMKAGICFIQKDIGEIKSILGIHDGRLSRLEEAVLK